MFRSEFFFRTTQELEYFFFLSRKVQFFFQNLTLHYMTKTLNQIIIFFLHQNQNIFFSNIGNQNIFLEKNHNPPPPPFKLNGRSFIDKKKCKQRFRKTYRIELAIKEIYFKSKIMQTRTKDSKTFHMPIKKQRHSLRGCIQDLHIDNKIR